jgi:very-short-patch-repair endonuclease
MRRPTAPARALRQRATPAERLLWSRLRDRRLGGFKFRRQAPVGGRIVDFLCLEKRLAIELDGSGHGYPAGEWRDRKRTIQLEKEGLRIIRFWNPQVLRDLEWVLDQILWELDPAKSRWPKPLDSSTESVR